MHGILVVTQLSSIVNIKVTDVCLFFCSSVNLIPLIETYMPQLEIARVSCYEIGLWWVCCNISFVGVGPVGSDITVVLCYLVKFPVGWCDFAKGPFEICLVFLVVLILPR